MKVRLEKSSLFNKTKTKTIAYITSKIRFLYEFVSAGMRQFRDVAKLKQIFHFMPTKTCVEGICGLEIIGK